MALRSGRLQRAQTRSAVSHRAIDHLVAQPRRDPAARDRRCLRTDADEGLLADVAKRSARPARSPSLPRCQPRLPEQAAAQRR